MKPRKKPSSGPAVLVVVSGGVAYPFATRGVRIVQVDFDNLTAGPDIAAYSVQDIQNMIDEVRSLPRGILRQSPGTLSDLRKALRARRAMA